MLLAVACNHSSTPNPPAPAASSSASTLSRVVILETKGRTIRVEVEVARQPKERAQGLMFRRELGAYHGMIFLFDTEEIQSFWMQNTYIPLDMIFINQAMQVVGVVENAEPLTSTARQVDKPSRYVLEVNGGFAKTHGIGPGTKVIFEGFKSN